MSLRLRARHIAALAHLCVLPFIEIDELTLLAAASRSGLHRTLAELNTARLVRRVPHSFRSARRAYRWIPTELGVRTLTDLDMVSEHHLSEAERETDTWIPVRRLTRPGAFRDCAHATAHWHRVLSHRLDILACVYQLLGAICRVKESRPAEFRLYRGMPYDAGVRMPTGECYGVIVRRPAFGSAPFRRRYAAAREYALGLTATFIVAPNEEDLRTVAREARPLEWTATAIAMPGQLDRSDERCWIAPDRPDVRLSLRKALNVWQGPGVLPNEPPAKRRRHPDETLAMPPHLSRSASSVLYAIADWPLAEPPTIEALTRTPGHWLKKLVSELRGYRLVRSVRAAGAYRLALADDGIRLTSSASRTNFRENRRRWSSARGTDGSFGGGMVNQLVREIRHNDMAHRFVRSVYCNSENGAAEVLAALPPHRGMKFYSRSGKTFSIRPDATIRARVSSRDHILLMEFERRAVFPKAMRERMVPYLRYFETEEVLRDYEVEPKVMVVLESHEIESRFLESQEAAGLSHLPILTSNVEVLDNSGPFGKVWHTVGSRDGNPTEFWTM